MSKNLFILTSAINTRFGIYSPEQRLAQTFDTFKSINQYAPGADIVLVEMGGVPLSVGAIARLEEYARVITYNASEAVTDIYNSTDNWDIVKNTTEVMIFAEVLESLLEDGTIDKYDRIFKLTARYMLNENFNLDYYSTVPDNIVLLKPRASQFPPEVTGGLTVQYMSRMFSWPADQTEIIVDTYNTGFTEMAKHMSAGGYFDLEHMLYKYLPKDTVIERDIIGVAGNLGPNGIAVKE